MFFVRATGLVAKSVPYGLVVFFFRFFFSFRVKIRDDGTLHFESRCVERERETGYLPPRARAGCDAFTRAESVRLYAFISLECIDRSSGFGGEKKTFEAKQTTAFGYAGRAAKILVHFYDTSRPFFLRERESFVLDY